MNVTLWIVAGVLALFFIGAGVNKLLRTKEKLLENPNMGWAADFSPGMLKLIGAAEVLGGIGLVLPAALDIAPILTPIAATGLAVIMVGAIITHARRKEYAPVVMNVVLLALAVFVAWGRFGPYAF
jgi:uncharacterized membrane protein YphA (DoxX/SURF4 family)